MSDPTTRVKNFWPGPITKFSMLCQEGVLDNVLYARAFTSEQQMELLDMVAGKFHEEPGVFKLLIVDSIMALFRVDYSGRGELADRQQHLAQVINIFLVVWDDLC